MMAPTSSPAPPTGITTSGWPLKVWLSRPSTVLSLSLLRWHNHWRTSHGVSSPDSSGHHRSHRCLTVCVRGDTPPGSGDGRGHVATSTEPLAKETKVRISITVRNIYGNDFSMWLYSGRLKILTDYFYISDWWSKWRWQWCCHGEWDKLCAPHKLQEQWNWTRDTQHTARYVCNYGNWKHNHTNLQYNTVDDSDVQFPMSVEAFPQYCVNMQKNSCHPFTEEFKVHSIIFIVATFLSTFMIIFSGHLHQKPQPSVRASV